MNRYTYVFAILLACSGLIWAAQNPVPFVNQPLQPSSATPGAAAFTITVNGTGFAPGATVQWNGTRLATTYISSSQLSAAAPAANVAAPSTATVTVLNPGTTAASNFIYFPVARPRESVAFAYPAMRPNLGLPPENDPACQAVGDFNGDGKPDIAIGEPRFNGGSLVILIGNGDGTFKNLPPILAPRCGAEGMAVGDFNGDGKLDLAISDFQSSTLSVLLGNGDGTFGAAPGTPAVVGSGPLELATGDFNGDGNLDLAVTNSRDGTISILLGNGNGTFRLAPGSPFAAGLDPVVGDFNRDGKLDLATIGEASSGAPILTVYLGNGDGTFTSAGASSVVLGDSGRVPVALATADFDGDGKLDLVVASGGYETVAVLLGKGDGTFALQPDCCGASGILARNDGDLGIGDFAGSGKLDLVISNEDDLIGPPPRFVTVFEGSGNGTFMPSHFSILQDAIQTNLAVADFNGDGQLDIAMTDPTYAEETILLQSAPTASGPDFSIEPGGDASVSVKAGNPATFPVKVTSVNGFTGVVTYSCSGLPANTTCSFSTYNSINIPESSDFYVDTVWSLFRLNVQTTAPTLVSSASPRREHSKPLGISSLLAGLIFSLFAIPARRWPPKVYFLSLAPFALLLPFLVLVPASCGGNEGGSTPPTPHPVGGTPSGTYTLTVTATSGRISHSTAVTLTVQ